MALIGRLVYGCRDCHGLFACKQGPWDRIGLDRSAVASSISYQIGWPSLNCFIPSLALSCTVRTVRRDVIEQEGKGVGTLQETLRALGPPVPEAWDVAPKVLSLGLCNDGQNNVLNCCTDLKSKSGCDVQTPQTGNGLTTGV